MPKAYRSWKVLPHDPIEEIEPSLWRVQARLPGMELRRVMTLAKMSDGRVVMHSPIALEEEAMKRVEAWGEPAFIVPPNGFHRLDAPAFKERYPDAKVVCPVGSRKKIEEVVPVDLTYREFPEDDRVKLEYLDGVAEQEGVMVVTTDAGTTLVFNDAIFNCPHGTGLAGFIFKHITQSTGGPRVSRLFKIFAIKDRRALRGSLERFAETPNLVRAIVSHHEVIHDDPAGTIRRVAAAL